MIVEKTNRDSESNIYSEKIQIVKKIDSGGKNIYSEKKSEIRNKEIEIRKKMQTVEKIYKQGGKTKTKVLERKIEISGKKKRQKHSGNKCIVKNIYINIEEKTQIWWKKIDSEKNIQIVEKNPQI